jgi:hypothetical protein
MTTPLQKAVPVKGDALKAALLAAVADGAEVPAYLARQLQEVCGYAQDKGFTPESFGALVRRWRQAMRAKGIAGCPLIPRLLDALQARAEGTLRRNANG